MKDQQAKRSPCGVAANVLDCNILVCKFKLQPILFTFGLIPLVLYYWYDPPPFLQLLVK